MGDTARTPDEVVRTAFGDCKDKATVHRALARLGHSYPVLLNSGAALIAPSDDRRVQSRDRCRQLAVQYSSSI